jgi:hypothetical protein
MSTPGHRGFQKRFLGVRLRVFLAASMFASVSAADRGGSPRLVLAPAEDPRACFEVRGLAPDLIAQLGKFGPRDPRWPEVFSVRVVPAVAGEQPPMLGSYGLTAECVRFCPRFPLQRGIKYRAVFDWPHLQASQNSRAARGTHFHICADLVVPVSRTGHPPRVVAIYPSGDELPENLLRIYIQFSAPMSQGNCYSRLHLRDETSGTEVQQPFLELPQELWSPDGTRLTLLLEPGRVKHDLVPRGELGPILVSGRTYSLRIDADWPDAEGRPLGASRCKTFRAAKAEFNRLDPNSWTIESPHSGTTAPLLVRFPKPLDRAMLERVIRVLGPAGVEVAGTIEVIREETCWTFQPREVWSTQRHVLVVSTLLEDSAGNNIRRPFEVDLKRSPHPPEAPAVVRIEFEPRDHN